MNFDEHLSRVQKSAHGPVVTKGFDLDLKSSDDSGGFSAYFAVFGNVDRAKEVIDVGAFKNLPSFAVDGWIGVNHDMQSLPVALVDSVVQDTYGLKVNARWHSTPAAQACRAVVNERLAAGKGVKCSIGYKVLDSYKDVVAGVPVRRLAALDLFEASIVNLPCNSAAEVIEAKDGNTASLNSSGLSYARSLIKSGKVSDGAWGFSGADGDALLGEGGDDWATYGKCHLAVDSGAEDNTKGHWKYPFAKKSGGVIKVYKAALRAIASRASQQGKGSIGSAASKLLESANGGDEGDDGGKSMIDGNTKILTLDALKSWLDAETKAGRVLSRANHERLKSWHGNLSTMCNQMKAMIDLHDPDRDPGDEPDDDGDEKEVRPERSVSPARTSGASYPAKGLERLRERIVRSRLSTLTLD